MAPATNINLNVKKSVYGKGNGTWNGPTNICTQNWSKTMTDLDEARKHVRNAEKNFTEGNQNLAAFQLDLANTWARIAEAHANHNMVDARRSFNSSFTMKSFR
jgi:hypothetical protein